jgi:hypothetical protein
MSVIQVFWMTVVVLEKYMSLENQVAALVNSTTALQNTVAAEVAKTRAENADFQAGIATRVSTQTMVAVRGSVAHSAFTPFSFENTSKIGSEASRRYSFMNMRQGESGGGNWNAFALYSYKHETSTSLAPISIAIPLIIFDNNSFSIGGNQPSPMASDSFAIGNQALTASLQFTNAVGIGSSANVTGNNQLQLGNPAMAVYSHNAIQLRSDRRDKTDITPTELGLDFIKALEPVDFRWDTRDSYRVAAPIPPIPISEEASEIEKENYDSAIAAYNSEIVAWKEANKTDALKPDGSKKRSRIHHGLIAQDVEALIKLTGKDFGGFQDHKRSDGQDVLSIGYTELIAPIIKALQELAKENEELRGRITTLEARK